MTQFLKYLLSMHISLHVIELISSNEKLQETIKDS